jgi:hypothetical protein
MAYDAETVSRPGPLVADWDAAKARAFGREPLRLRHRLHEDPLFDDAGLEQVLDRYPREALGVFTMGEDPVDWRSWRRGAAGSLTGSQLLDAAKAGRIWLNLRAVNAHIPDYAALSDAMFRDFEANAPGLRTFKRDVGLLISSANAQVFYHLDMPLVALWQLRGNKRMFVYPVSEPFVAAEQLERIAARDMPEQLPFDPAWDRRAQVFDMAPGDLVTWPQNAPHRIENGPMLNVSLSVEFMTPQALLRANVLYANRVLRRRTGHAARAGTDLGPTLLAKLAVARVAKALRREPERSAPPASFRLDPARPGVLLPA